MKASWLTPVIFAAILINLGYAVRDNLSAQAARRSAVASDRDAVGAGGPPRGGPMLGEASKVRIVRPSRGGYGLSDEAGSNGASVHAHSRSDSVSASSAPVSTTAKVPTSAVASLSAAVGTGAENPWRTGWMTSYAVWEGLTGCGANGCITACDTYLDDFALTVASNPSLGLRCNQRVRLLWWDKAHRRMVRATATVTDRTASRYTMEFSYRLSRIFGAPPQLGQPLTWSAYVSWRPA